MVCIYCGRDTKVTNSRTNSRRPSVWRRRACFACVAQFTTIELPDYAAALVVESGNKTRLVPFSRDKLFLSLHLALGHRKDSLNSSTALTETVISRIVNKKRIKEGVVRTKDIANLAYEVLKRFDPLAAGSYKAYHQKALK